MAPLFIQNPTYCEVVYMLEVSDPFVNAAINFDANTGEFTFFYNSDVSLAGLVSQDYTITLKGVLGSLNTLEAQTSFTLTLKNPCVDPSFV